MQNNKPRYLSKSRFRLALSCPTKLYYTNKLDYSNVNETDSFLENLAQGGFQVEELARLYHPDGIAILGEDWNYIKLAEKTTKLLEQENVTIFEAAFLIDGLFIRVDILQKRGNNVRLIEVKAKSIDGTNHISFLKKGKLSFQTELYDVAFQQYVIQKCYPKWNITAHLNLVDKSAYTSINGLYGHFKIHPDSELRTGVRVTPGLKIEDLGNSILITIIVQEEIDFIFKNNPHWPEISFDAMVETFKHHYSNDVKFVTPIDNKCFSCEFKNPNPTKNEKSGFHECWRMQLPQIRPDLIPITDEKINAKTTFEIWNKPIKKAFETGKIFISDLTESDIVFKPEAYGMSRSERQWAQIEKHQNDDNSIYVNKENLKHEISQWQFPLNFIDFETSAVALPFTAGMHPYEQLAFQFSHHTVDQDGTISHASEYINLDIGVFPNFDFIRALKKSLNKNNGSIFRYHNHENTIVNVIYRQLKQSDEPDKDELCAFIESISHPTGGNPFKYEAGQRDMIDLQKTVVRNYFHPQTNGSNSIKAILPAVLESSDFLKAKYTKPLKVINLTSLNFDKDYHFLTIKNNQPVNPYKLLPPLFEGISNDDLENAIDNSAKIIREISDGGAALFAYAKMQDECISNLERSETEKALLRYCELDTLAMVMIYEHFVELIES